MTGSNTTVTTWSRHVPGLQLAWDATSLRSLATCPRKYEYEMVRGLRTGGGNTATSFGSYFHSAVEEFDKARCRGETVAVAARVALRWVLANSGEYDAGFSDETGFCAPVWRPWAGDGKKTRHALVRAVIWYCDAQQDVGGVQPYAFPDGTPAVELSFRLPLGREFSPAAAGYGLHAPEPYLLCGHMDSLATFGGQTFVRERKTTEKTLGGYYFDNYSPDPQVDTYSVAASVLFPELKIAGVLLEATQSAVQFARFHTQPLYRTPEQREEWLGEVLGLIAEAESYARAAYWPRRTAVCGLYGGCPFRKVCSRSPGVRPHFLASAEFVERRWDPLQVR